MNKVAPARTRRMAQRRPALPRDVAIEAWLEEQTATAPKPLRDLVNGALRSSRAFEKAEQIETGDMYEFLLALFRYVGVIRGFSAPETKKRPGAARVSLTRAEADKDPAARAILRIFAGCSVHAKDAPEAEAWARWQTSKAPKLVRDMVSGAFESARAAQRQGLIDEADADAFLGAFVRYVSDFAIGMGGAGNADARLYPRKKAA
jgi:hypothetical protein